MAAKLQATLTFGPADVHELLRAHVESGGYFVETIDDAGDGTYEVRARPMTLEELRVHNLPTESVEDRLQARFEALVAETTRAHEHFKSMLERQVRDIDASMRDRIQDIQSLNDSMSQAVSEIHALADQYANTPTFAPAEPPPPEPEPIQVMFPNPMHRTPEVPALPTSSHTVESLSFADAVHSILETAAATNSSNAEVQRRFAQLRKELVREAEEVELDDPREHIPGETDAFPTDLAQR